VILIEGTGWTPKEGAGGWDFHSRRSRPVISMFPSSVNSRWRTFRSAIEAAFRRRGLIEEPLKYASADTHNTFILADADAELDGGPLGVPPGIRRKAEKHGNLFSGRQGIMFLWCSQDSSRVMTQGG
jgi:hypothetical protein